MGRPSLSPSLPSPFLPPSLPPSLPLSQRDSLSSKYPEISKRAAGERAGRGGGGSRGGAHQLHTRLGRPRRHRAHGGGGDGGGGGVSFGVQPPDLRAMRQRSSQGMEGVGREIPDMRSKRDDARGQR